MRSVIALALFGLLAACNCKPVETHLTEEQKNMHADELWAELEAQKNGD